MAVRDDLRPHVREAAAANRGQSMQETREIVKALPALVIPVPGRAWVSKTRRSIIFLSLLTALFLTVEAAIIGKLLSLPLRNSYFRH